jgi:hypothetical protein
MKSNQLIQNPKPITKKDLMNPNLIKKINNEYKIKFLDKYVKITIGRIYWLTIKNHKQGLKVNTYGIMDYYGRSFSDFLSHLNFIYTGIDRQIYSYSHLMTHDDIAPFPDDPIDLITADDYNKTLDRIIDGLKELFPDCLVQIDSLEKKYISIALN